VIVSPDGQCIISGSEDTSIRIWNADYSAETITIGHAVAVTMLALSHDGTHLASSSRDKRIRMWDTNSGVEVLHPLEGHEDIILSISFSPDGMKIVSGSDVNEGAIHIWDATSGGLALRPL
jgi:WD40 repeat protein